MGDGGRNRLLDGPGECRKVEALPPNEGREAEQGWQAGCRQR